MSTITITRVVDAPPKRAFAAWVDTELLATWWWPHLTDTTYEIDARVGGKLRIDSPTAGIAVAGQLLAVDEPRLLRFTWIWDDDGTASRDGGPVVDTVEVAFVALDDERTEVTVAHHSVAHVPDGGAEQGWNDCLDRLVALT